MIYYGAHCPIAPEEVRSLLKKILTIGITVFVIFFIAYKPDSAATVAKTIGGGIIEILSGIGNFFSALVS